MKSKLFSILLLVPVFFSCNRTTTDQAGSENDQFTFAFLTDIHVEHGRNADNGFLQAIEHVNSDAPDFVVTGGDLIADALGKDEEYATDLLKLYNELSENFKMPLYNTMGNHDEFGFYEKSGVSQDHPFYGDKMYEDRIGKRYYAFTHKGWRFYILDSVEETEEREYEGHVDSIQLKWLKEDLESVDKDMPVVIVTHIPLLTSYGQIENGATSPNAKSLVVVNSKEVLDLFKEHSLKLVLQGHLHIVEDAYINDIHFVTGGAVCARWWLGPRGKMEEGYMLIHVNGEEFSWEYVDYGWEVTS